MVLRNQQLSGYPIAETQLAELLRGAGLREVRRLRTATLISEAMVVVAEPLSSERFTAERDFTVGKVNRSDLLNAQC